MFKVMSSDCVPTRGSKYSACVDLYSREDLVIGAGETVKVPLGVKIDEEFLEQISYNNRGKFGLDYHNTFMSSHYLQLEPRSSLRAKGLIVGTGIIDLDFKDEIIMVVHNPIDLDVIDLSARLIVMGYDLGKNGLSADDITEALNCFSKENKIKQKQFVINKGDKIAQIMLCEHKSYLFGIDTYEERSGGFGSTD